MAAQAFRSAPSRLCAMLYACTLLLLVALPAVFAASTPPTCHCPPEIDLPDYSIFVEHTFDGVRSDNEGRLAVGGDASLVFYSVGDKLPNSHGSRNDTLVGGNLTWSDGQTFFGNIVVAGSAQLARVGIPNGELLEHTPLNVDMAGTFRQLRVLSANLGALPATAEILREYSALTLRGTDPVANFWNLDAATLSDASMLTISVPAPAFAVVNVYGDAATFCCKEVLLASGADPRRVVYNFFQASELSIHSITVKGSVLAPLAALAFDNGNVDGSIYVRSFTGTGETHLFVPESVQPPCPACEDCADTPAEATEWTLSFDDWQYSSQADRTTFSYSVHTAGPGEPRALEVCEEGPFGIPQCHSLTHWDLSFDVARASSVLYSLSSAGLEVGDDASVTFNGAPFFGAIFPSGRESTVGLTLSFHIAVEGKACYSPQPYVLKGLSRCGSGVIEAPDFDNLHECDFAVPDDSDCEYNEVVVRVPMSHLCEA
eukprot:TRINITY_DN1163_c0_g1_i1.p1 TRINITY_DN1163_c0_g1~~TRINITY_DN1163_c0_g1_i1.p1  ORF type:complete len:513 (+),score=156.13 TRINITY_DN1163_c0_g1_i1:81-1541(+)